MKQVTQRLRDGRIEVLDVPPPVVAPESVLVEVRASLLSAGTERSKIQAGRKNLVQKARARPDQVALVLEKARRDGLRETVAAVRARLDDPSVLGYSCAGVVVEVGDLVHDLTPGDRVACGGTTAAHAQLVCVPGNLCVPLPVGVGFEHGAFAAVGAIAMHGVRQAEAALGERVAVIGQGLVGQLTGKLLRAAGCSVVGIDLDAHLLDHAARTGAIDVAAARLDIDDAAPPPGAGDCDAVIIAAAAPSDDPVRLAAALCRDRGRVVIVGDVGLQIPRAPYYDKEIDLRFSRSYGPGRYDRTYEERGLDYPIGYVRWTERRNMEAFVVLVAEGHVDVTSLISERVRLEDAPQAYDRLASSGSSPLGIVLQYEPIPDPPKAAPNVSPAAGGAGFGLIGAGSFATRILVPALTDAGFTLSTVASAGGLSAAAVAERNPGTRAASPEEVIADAVPLLVVCTRHATHADLSERGLRAGKAVYVEKPPCLTWVELERVARARAETGQALLVGFNRRHAPLVTALREHIARPGHPKEVLIRVNAARLPADHWLNDPADGGGRLLGEGCHFVDLAAWLVGGPPDQVSCTIRPLPGETAQTAQRFSITLQFADGSLATIVYTDGGAAGLAKEHVEAHSGGRSAVLDDFRSLRLYDGSKSRRLGSRAHDKGHRAQFRAVRDALGGAPIDPQLDPLLSMAATLAALDAARTGRARAIEPMRPSPEIAES